MKEIIPGLILGGLRDLNDILKAEPNVLFPLDRLPGTVWDSGFRGEIVYYPITDMDVLPDDVLNKLVDAIVARLQAQKRVAVFCVGGHGRTGYAASCVLHRLGYDNPITFLRKNYSMSAVETEAQAEAVFRYIDRHRNI